MAELCPACGRQATPAEMPICPSCRRALDEIEEQRDVKIVVLGIRAGKTAEMLRAADAARSAGMNVIVLEEPRRPPEIEVMLTKAMRQIDGAAKERHHPVGTTPRSIRPRRRGSP